MDHPIVDLIDAFTAAGWDKWETLKVLIKVVCDHALAYPRGPRSIPQIEKAEINWHSLCDGRRPRGDDKMTVSDDAIYLDAYGCMGARISNG
jgi:hypothetical protein